MRASAFMRSAAGASLQAAWNGSTGVDESLHHGVPCATPALSVPHLLTHMLCPRSPSYPPAPPPSQPPPPPHTTPHPQEVQSDHYEEYLRPELQAAGYVGIYKKKTGEVGGWLVG